MKHLSLIPLALAMLGLTECEIVLDVEEGGMASDREQVKSSLLQVRTQGGGTTSDGTFRLSADPDWDSVNCYTF